LALGKSIVSGIKSGAHVVQTGFQGLRLKRDRDAGPLARGGVLGSFVRAHALVHVGSNIRDGEGKRDLVVEERDAGKNQEIHGISTESSEEYEK
jgi:hypothetical protein